MTNTIRAGLYARVSTDGQETAGQLAALRQYATAYGWETVDFVDHAVSGHDDSRPALDRLLADIAAGRINVVLAWRLDRLGRSLRDLVNIVSTLRDVGVRVVTLEGFDTANDYSPMLLGILAGLAEAESRRMSARVRLNVKTRRDRGETFGRQQTVIRRDALDSVEKLSLRDAAKKLGVTSSVLYLVRNPEKRAQYFAQRKAKAKPRSMLTARLDAVVEQRRKANATA